MIHNQSFHFDIANVSAAQGNNVDCDEAMNSSLWLALANINVILCHYVDNRGPTVKLALATNISLTLAK